MTEDPDMERVKKLVVEGWSDEGHSMVRLTEDQQVLLSEDMLIRFQREIGFESYVVMEIDEHATRLDDGTVIVECSGRVRL